MNRVYILIVNWNGWRDTIECLESVFRNNHPDYRVIVCDNGSEDGSLDRVKAWASGDLDVWIQKGNPLRRLTNPPLPKPIPIVEYDRDRAESGGDPEEAKTRLILVNTGANLGFAGGNNVGLRYALRRDDFEFAWLLNNDTVVEPDALSHLVRRMEEKPHAGMCGSTLPFYHAPEILWARGGATYNKWIVHARCLGYRQPVNERIDPGEIERRMDYVAGASMLVSKGFLRDVGLLCEDYFLFYEEPDWAARAAGRYCMAYSPGSVVYHKVGAAVDTLGKPGEGRRRIVDLTMRNAIRFTRKFCPWALPTVYLRVLLQTIVCWVRDRLDKSGPRGKPA